MKERKDYESPTIEITEFELCDSIATSASGGVGTAEWIFDE